MFKTKRAGGILILSMILSVSTFVSAQVPGEPGESIRQQLEHIMVEQFNAERTGNIAFLEKLLAPDFSVMTSEGATLNKAQLLERVKRPAFIMKELHSDILSVRVYGSTAVVIDRTTIKTVDNGKPFSAVSQAVRIFVRRTGGWQLVYVQASPLKTGRGSTK